MIKSLTAFHRNDFRKWLESNHKNQKKVAVILHKRHTGKQAPSHRELMEESERIKKSTNPHKTI